MVKQILKKIINKITAGEVEEIVEAPKYNEFGTCIACQGGKTECLHNNLIVSGRNTVCATCGYCVKCG